MTALLLAEPQPASVASSNSSCATTAWKSSPTSAPRQLPRAADPGTYAHER